MELNQCIEFMKKKHKNQKRKHGTPYYLHPLTVSNILKIKGFPLEYQVAGLFHDLLEDTDATLEEIKELSNTKVAETVILLTKEKGYDMAEYIEKISKNNMAKIIKLVDRIHNLSEAHLASIEFQEKYIKETEEWFITLAKNSIFEEDLNKILLELKTNVSKIKNSHNNTSLFQKKVKKSNYIKFGTKETNSSLVEDYKKTSIIIASKSGSNESNQECFITENNLVKESSNHLVKKKNRKI